MMRVHRPEGPMSVRPTVHPSKSPFVHKSIRPQVHSYGARSPEHPLELLANRLKTNIRVERNLATGSANDITSGYNYHNAVKLPRRTPAGRAGAISRVKMKTSRRRLAGSSLLLTAALAFGSLSDNCHSSLNHLHFPHWTFHT